MDPFALIWVGIVAALVLAFWLVGRFYPGSGLNEIGQRSTREIVENREALEADDLEQMLAAHNARRRARGQQEVTAGDLEMRVAGDLRDQQRRSEQYLADRKETALADEDADQMREAINARRRARGEPTRTREDVRREFGQ